MGKTEASFCKGKKSMIIDKHGRKVEGYWWSSYSPEYPKPTANVLSEEEAQQIFELIRKKEQQRKLHTKDFQLRELIKHLSDHQNIVKVIGIGQKL
jgi:hypothetical protein